MGFEEALLMVWTASPLLGPVSLSWWLPFDFFLEQITLNHFWWCAAFPSFHIREIALAVFGLLGWLWSFIHFQSCQEISPSLWLHQFQTVHSVMRPCQPSHLKNPFWAIQIQIPWRSPNQCPVCIMSLKVLPQWICLPPLHNGMSMFLCHKFHFQPLFIRPFWKGSLLHWV